MFIAGHRVRQLAPGPKTAQLLTPGVWDSPQLKLPVADLNRRSFAANRAHSHTRVHLFSRKRLLALEMDVDFAEAAPRAARTHSESSSERRSLPATVRHASEPGACPRPLNPPGRQTHPHAFTGSVSPKPSIDCPWLDLTFVSSSFCVFWICRERLVYLLRDSTRCMRSPLRSRVRTLPLSPHYASAIGTGLLLPQ